LSGEVAPFVTAVGIDTTVSAAAANSVSFDVNGTVAQNLSGAIMAGLEASPLGPFSSIGFSVDQTYGSVDGNATGTYHYQHTFAPAAISGGQVTANYNGGASGTSTINGDFSGAQVGDFVSAFTGISGPQDPNFPPAPNVILAINGTASATISGTIPAGDSQASIVIGYAGNAQFVDSSFSSGSSGAFTTNGTPGGTAGIGLISSTSFTFGPGLPVVGSLPFGGSPGVGPANCLLTGWDASNDPGPAQTGSLTPATPPGSTTALVKASGGVISQAGTSVLITPANSAFVSLNPNPPNAPGASYNMGVGAQITVTLPNSVGSIGFPVSSCALIGTQPYGGRVTVTANAGLCNFTITDSGTPSTPALVTFQYTATSNGPPSETSTAGTITLHIGTPPVDQVIGQNVNPGQLVLSCNAPAPTGWPTTSCPIINLSDITLNGLTQTTSHAANTIYVSDDRGDPTSGWSLTAYMVPTASNTNAGCATVAAFCDQSAGNGTGNGVIPAANMALSTPACAAYTGTTNPVVGGTAGTLASPLGLCSAAAGTSGGTFTVGTNFTLTIPPTVFAGQYYGTVEYLVIAT
jgi:hypothetical protein